jgi:hypothetical protein
VESLLCIDASNLKAEDERLSVGPSVINSISIKKQGRRDIVCKIYTIVRQVFSPPLQLSAERNHTDADRKSMHLDSSVRSYKLEIDTSTGG